MQRQSIRFIHSADLHLDSPYKGLSNLPEQIFNDVKQSTLVAYQRLINLAIEQQVDFILIVGDLFDLDSTSIKSTLALKKGLEKLNENGIKAYISFGNHDYMMQSKADLTFPTNTYVFPAEKVSKVIFEKNGHPSVEINGFSYKEQAVIERMVEHYPTEKSELYQIGTLHGSLQTNQEHDTYAPFLIEDLKVKPMDYWALGHIHKRELLLEDPYAVYPGNIQGRHMKETGEKGCYVVELTPYKTNLNFYPLQEVIFREEELVLEDIQEIADLLSAIEQFKETFRQEQNKTFMRLSIILSSSQLSLKHIDLDELKELINEAEEEEINWIWVNEIFVKEKTTYHRDEIKQSNPFIGEVIQTIDQQEDVRVYIQDLLRHRTFKKHVRWDLDEMESEIKSEAEHLLINELLKNG